MREVTAIDGYKGQLKALIYLALLGALAVVLLIALNAPYLNILALHKEISLVPSFTDGRLIDMFDTVIIQPIVGLNFKAALDSVPVFGSIVSHVWVTIAPNVYPIVIQHTLNIDLADIKYLAYRAHSHFLSLIQMTNGIYVWLLPIWATARFPDSAFWYSKPVEPIRNGGEVYAQDIRDLLIGHPLVPIKAAKDIWLWIPTGLISLTAALYTVALKPVKNRCTGNIVTLAYLLARKLLLQIQSFQFCLWRSHKLVVGRHSLLKLRHIIPWLYLELYNTGDYTTAMWKGQVA